MSEAPTKGTADRIVWREPGDLVDHPQLESIPLAGGESKDRLFASVSERGVDTPVHITAKNEIVRGRNRCRAAAAAGKRVPCVVLPPDAPIFEILCDDLLAVRRYTKGGLAYLLQPLLEPVVEEGIKKRSEKLRNSRKSPEETFGSNEHKTEMARRALEDTEMPLNPRELENLEDACARYGFGRNLYFQARRLRAIYSVDADYKEATEQRVIEGEMGLGPAIAGYKGGKNKGGNRPPADYAALLPSTFTTMKNGLGQWAKFDDTTRQVIFNDWVELVKILPAELLMAVPKYKGGGK